MCQLWVPVQYGTESCSVTPQKVQILTYLIVAEACPNIRNLPDVLVISFPNQAICWPLQHLHFCIPRGTPKYLPIFQSLQITHGPLSKFFRQAGNAFVCSVTATLTYGAQQAVHAAFPTLAFHLLESHKHRRNPILQFTVQLSGTASISAHRRHSACGSPGII